MTQSSTITTVTNENNQRPRRQRRNRRRRGQQAGGQPAQKQTTTKPRVTFPDLLSPCSRDYLSVMENPWSGKVSCVPTIPSIPSRKVRYWVKGIVRTGTTGFGYVAFNPFNVTNDNGGFANANSVFYTGNAYTSSLININPAAPGVNVANLNSEYSSAAVDGFRYRLVGAGLRVRYSGTELNRGGRFILLEEPDHGDLNSYSTSSFEEYDTHRVFAPDRRWKSVTFHPADEDEFDYFVWASRPTNYFLGIILESPQADITMAVEFEAVACYEMIGNAVRGLTPTPVDVVGLSAVQTFVNSPNTRVPREGDRSNWVNYALNQTGRLLWDMGSGIVRSYFERPTVMKNLVTVPSTTPLIEEAE